ncbi:MAG: helix-turn-helix transcriptional regulator [Paracoccaceae bacterium]|nr:helix-turn-helix transcriptional regulator [Paracoccaceae bacterium]
MATGTTDGWFSEETATFGDRVAGAREAAGMTQSQLARRIGVRLKTLTDWEEDVAEPRANKLQMLAGMLNVSIMWLLTGRGDGLDAPTDIAAPSSDARAIMTEMRNIRMQGLDLTNRMGKLEKHLIDLLKDAG